MDAFIVIAMAAPLMLGGAALIIELERCLAAWPRPGDAAVTTVVTVADYPDGSIGEVTVVIANPDSRAVLVGVTPRRRGWPGRGQRTTIASRTTRRRYRADRQATVSAVPPNTITSIPVPIMSDFRRCRLAIVVGQSGGRLRVISVPITIARPTMTGGPDASVLPLPPVFRWPH